MHVIQGFTGSVSKKDIQIQKGFSHLLLVKNGNANKIVNERITVAIKGSSNEQTILSNIKVRDVALISQFGGGYLLEQLSGANVKSSFPMELSLGSAISLVNSEYVSVDLDNLDATATYDLFAFEHILQSRSYLKYQIDLAQGGEPTQKPFALGANCSMLAIRNNGALSKLILTGNNNVQVVYTTEELSAINRELNGMVIAPDTLIEGDAVNQTLMGGAVDFFFIPAVDYKNAEIHTTGAAELSVIRVNQFAY